MTTKKQTKIKITKTTYEDGTVYYYADTYIPFKKIKNEEEFVINIKDLKEKTL